MKRFVFVALILLHCVITTASGKEMMKDEFSITVPDDWVQIPVYMIEEHENLVAINTPNAKKQHYDYGFQPDSNKRIATPYILLQINYGGRMPKKEIIGYSDFSLQESMDKENFGPSLTKLKVDKLTYDKTTNRIWMRMESVVNGRDYTSLSGIIPTENGYILAAGNTSTKDLLITGETFKSIIASIKPSPKLAYKEKFSEKYPFFATLVSPKFIGRYLAFMILAGIFVLAQKINKKKNNKKSALLNVSRK